MPTPKTLAIALIAALALALAACDSAPETSDDDPAVEAQDDESDTPEETEAVEEEDDDEAAADDDPLAAPDTVAEPPEEAEVTDSDLAYQVLEEGDGDSNPAETDTVSVHYTGWTTDGEMFDSSVERGEPTSFPLNRVIDGWTEGVQLMVEGERTLFWIPEDLAYGGQPGRPAGMLVFEIELIEIQ